MCGNSDNCSYSSSAVSILEPPSSHLRSAFRIWVVAALVGDEVCEAISED